MKTTIAPITRAAGRHSLAVLALFVALGGTGYAAANHLMARNTVGSAQVINGSLQKKDLSKKALTALKGARGARGLRGPVGAAGIQGAPGTMGSPGAMGAQGQPGVQGLQGPAGPALVRTTPGAVTIATLDAAGVGIGHDGEDTSAIIGADGLGLLSYFDETNTDLRVAHCNDVACSGATKTTLDSAGDVGRGSSVVLGADGLGLISYRDKTNGTLKVAHCDNTACTSATVSTVQSNIGSNPLSWDTSATVGPGPEGLALISYTTQSGVELHVAHCANLKCTSASASPELDGASIAGEPSMTLGADGLGLISYRATNEDLRVAHCNDVACTSAVVTILDSLGSVGGNSSVAIGTDGLGLIAYTDDTNDHLKVAHCNNRACTNATSSTIDNAANSGGWPSVTIGTDGLGLISYSSNGYLSFAHCRSSDCTSASVNTPVKFANGTEASLTIGTDGLGLVSHYDRSTGKLKVAHCSNPFCVPYLRRR